MAHMDYSVLMSVYYKEHPEFLRQAMESIANQTVPTNDFVLVCDGPLNEQLDEVIAQMQDVFGQLLHVVRLEKNMGLGNALNIGIQYCKNDLVARMDSDDISRSDRCERQLNAFSSIPGLGLLSSSILEFSNDINEVTGKRAVPEANDAILACSRRRNPMNHPAIMFRKREVEAAGGYSEEFHLFEDYYLWVRMLQKGVIAANLKESLLYMRTPADMFQRRGGVQYAKDMLKFRWWMHKSGWSTWKDFILSALPQAVVCVMPNLIRQKVYANLHDKKRK